MSTSSNPRHNVSIEVTVGVFIAAVFLALCVFTIAISGNALFKKHQSKIEVILPDAMGLRRNDLVIARGTAVGVVDDVYYDQDGIHVIAKLDAPVVFHEGYRISVAQTSILGGRQLVVFEGNPEAERITDTTALMGIAPANLMDDATDVVNKLRDFMHGNFISDLEATSANIAEISDRLNRGEGTLGKLLSPDDALYNDLHDAIVDFRAFVKGDFFANLDKTSANIAEMTDRLNRGEGTLGKLLSPDDSLYNNLNGTVKGARELLDDVRETTPVSTFSSFIFGAF